MSIKMPFISEFNYSPNFNPIKRRLSQIKFIIFHYTGMKSESSAIKKLTNSNSEVSSHYLVKNNGQIVVLVPDRYIAWHAGISLWKNYKSLNKNSIGVEISNPGHDFSYRKFSKIQITSIIKLSKFLIKKYNIKSKNILGHSDIAPDRKKDPGEKFPWKYLSQHKIGLWYNFDQKRLIKKRFLKTSNLEKKLFFKNICKIGYSIKVSNNINLNEAQYIKTVIKAFQRRFRQDQIDGKIDQECLIISKNLIKKFL
jgi:N-acetylmuramoyl-L-alanine amidase